MYGGYGNIWSQGSSQWPSVNVTNQNQLPTGQNQQHGIQTFPGQNMMAFGGDLSNMGSHNAAAASMMGYMNMGVGGANPFMNYGGVAAGFGIQTNTASSNNTWLSNQQFQLQQAFPNGRPPLPPGPPPPDTPKDSHTPNASSSVLSPAITNQQRAPPPPPPPPPPSKSPILSTSAVSIGNIVGSGNSLNLEDAYNLIKNVTAYGMLPSCGPLAPSATLNVSEELFGSKSINKGIPGLDIMEEEKPLTPAHLAVVDLEQDAEAFSQNESTKPDTGVFLLQSNSERIRKEERMNSNEHLRDNVNSKQNPSGFKAKGLVWELRPDVKTHEWEHNDDVLADETEARSLSSTRLTEIKTGLSFVSEKLQDSKPIYGKFGNKDKPLSEKCTTREADKNSENRVRIPLESADGKELVYDRKTLKQFDQKFREWESEFENWKQQNQNHPNHSSYNQYLEQWNFWREQLIEQRRSILDTMTKAKLDSKEILMAKFESLDANILERTSIEDISIANQPGEIFTKKDNDKKLEESDMENVFKATSKGSEGDRTHIPLTTPMIVPAVDSRQDRSDLRTNDIPPLIPGLNGKKSLVPANDRTGRDRPVERILRNSNSSNDRNERNIFNDDFNQNQTEENPFMASGPGASRFEKQFPDRSTEQKNNDSKFTPVSNARLPFEWTLSQKTKDKNPFDMIQSSDNPFMQQPSGPNPFDIKPEQRLPSLDDYIKRTSLDFPISSSGSSAKMKTDNPFETISTVSNESHHTSTHKELQFERIPRDPQGTTKKSNTVNSNASIRLEANPIGMPLLVAAKAHSPPPQRVEDEISRLFSRDRGPVLRDVNDTNNEYDMDDDFVEDAEVIDYGAGGNSMDSMDFPRGENPDTNNNNTDDDADFSLEDSEVIDYSQGMPPYDVGMGQFAEYSEEFEQGYPPTFGSEIRGRGRGHQAQAAWNRGHSRGPHSEHPFGRGSSNFQYSSDSSASRGRGSFRGVGRGFHGPAPPQEWFQHDNRESQYQFSVVTGNTDPEIIELSPSPEPNTTGIKIAPPNPEFERGDRRSRSREGFPRERSRSRSRERVSRRPRDDSDRRGEDSYGSRRERDRDRRGVSPDRRSRYDDRDQRRDRDRLRDRDRRGRSKSRSRSPAADRQPIIRNPLFPSASTGMLGVHPASNPLPPRYQTVLIEDILNTPGRSKRPSRLVIFIRGLPGSGKSHIVKLIKEREVEMGGKAPRILSLDNYFITEMEKKEKDPITGVEVKKTVMEYEFDEEREPLYRAQLVRQFKKTLDEGYFSFVIVDCVNEYVRQFEEMATAATQKRFQAYVAEIEESVDVCVKRNVHKRTRDEILKIHKNWERTPSHFIKLDTRTLLQDEAIQEVEMEDVSDVEADSGEKNKALTPAERGKVGPQVVDLEDIEDEDSSDNILVSSKWDAIEPSQEKLNKLDGLMRRRRVNSEDAQVDSAPSIETWLTSNVPEDYVQRRPSQPGQKRVRWADIEERRQQERMREVGFVVGQTDWKRMMDPTFGSSALTKTKFF